MDKAKAGVKFNPEQLAWLDLIRDHIATSLSIEPEDLELSPSTSAAAWARRINSSAKQLPKPLDELNAVLAA